MPRHTRPALPPTIFLNSPSQSQSQQPIQLHHPYYNPAYGLLEPQPVPPQSRPSASPPASSSSPQPSLRSTARRVSNNYGYTWPRNGASSSRFEVVSPYQRAAARRRSSGSFGKNVGLPLVVVPAWSEVEAGIKELSCRGYEIGAGIGELGEKLSHRVPGLKGSVAFLSTLRANIHLASASPQPSPYIRPACPSPIPSPLPSLAATSGSTTTTTVSPLTMPPGASSPDAAPSQQPDLSTIPPLIYSRATTPATRTDALRLIADSVAQKRQASAYTLVWSPPFFAAILFALVAAHHYLYKSTSDLPILLTTGAGIVMTCLIAVRGAVGGYLVQAEGINWQWLGTDELFIAEFGEDVIGAVAYRVVDGTEGTNPDETGATATTSSAGGGGSSRRRRGNSATKSKTSQPTITRTCILRAWTVRKRERGRGVGRGLLEALVSHCIRDLDCTDVRFAQLPYSEKPVTEEPTRAGAQRVVKGWMAKFGMVDSMLERSENRAKGCLESVVREELESGGAG